MSEQITTAAELDALPVGSVVLWHGRAWTRIGSRQHPFYPEAEWLEPLGGFVRPENVGREFGRGLPGELIGGTVVYRPDRDLVARVEAAALRRAEEDE